MIFHTSRSIVSGLGVLIICAIGIDFKYHFEYNELIQFDKLEFDKENIYEIQRNAYCC